MNGTVRIYLPIFCLAMLLLAITILLAVLIITHQNHILSFATDAIIHNH